VIAFVFLVGGALENMQEEIIPLVPVLLLLTTRLGFDPLIAAAVSIGAAEVGSAFSGRANKRARWRRARPRDRDFAIFIVGVMKYG